MSKNDNLIPQTVSLLTKKGIMMMAPFPTINGDFFTRGTDRQDLESSYINQARKVPKIFTLTIKSLIWFMGDFTS